MPLRYLDTHKLLELAVKSEAQGYNAQLDVDWVKDEVAPDAFHLVVFAMYHDHIKGKPAPRHVRLAISVLTPEEELQTCQVDVSIADYESLPVLTKEAISEEGWAKLSPGSIDAILTSVNDEPLDLEKLETLGE